MAEGMVFLGRIKHEFTDFHAILPELKFLSPLLFIQLRDHLLESRRIFVSVEPSVQPGAEQPFLYVHVPVVDVRDMPFVQLATFVEQIDEVLE
jgi:hypothetical protein